MKKTAQPEHSQSLQKILFGSPKRMLFDVIVILCVCGVLGLVFLYFTHSFAKDEAMPMEQALLEAGATKQCESSDAGRGPSVQRPSYRALYTIRSRSEDLQHLLQRISNARGYNVQVSKPGHLNRVGLVDTFSKKVTISALRMVALSSILKYTLKKYMQDPNLFVRIKKQ